MRTSVYLKDDRKKIIQIYSAVTPFPYEIGDEVIVKGVVKDFYGNKEINSGFPSITEDTKSQKRSATST